MVKTYIGIDNGSSGAVAVLAPGKEPFMCCTPTMETLNYTKEVQRINRLDYDKLHSLLQPYCAEGTLPFCVMERPLVNPQKFAASLLAVRVFEATILCLEHLMVPYEVVDSRKWQKELLPKGIKGTADLKQASFDVGLRLFPKCMPIILKQKDADSLLMAEWARRTGL